MLNERIPEGRDGLDEKNASGGQTAARRKRFAFIGKHRLPLLLLLLPQAEPELVREEGDELAVRGLP